MSSRDSSLEVQADVEAKPEKKLRHHSASSSLDDASCSAGMAGVRGAVGGTCPCPSACCCLHHHDNRCCSSARWAKEPSTSSSSSSGGKKSKGKLRKRGDSSGSKGGMKIKETREDMDAQLLEQRSTNSSEFDSPSLSGSLPSVADSHCSHFSSEFSDPETSRAPQPPCFDPTESHPHPPTTLNGVTVTPMPEVEHDRLEQCLPQTGAATAFAHLSLSSSPPASPEGGSCGTFLYIAEDNAGLVGDTEPDSVSIDPEQEEDLKENNNNTTTTVRSISPTRSGCIQTDI